MQCTLQSCFWSPSQSTLSPLGIGAVPPEGSSRQGIEAEAKGGSAHSRAGLYRPAKAPCHLQDQILFHMKGETGRRTSGCRLRV
eukprot:scaffold37701_cov17-Tisochrysis_lutea.AAC.3